jgi:hypothetical protein
MKSPAQARSHFAGPDALLCVLDDALLPAERKMVELGEESRVRDSRVSFQARPAPRDVARVSRPRAAGKQAAWTPPTR